jgi:ABC-type Fe3+/spermidine/putrescine transport system ATPase subunit
MAAAAQIVIDRVNHLYRPPRGREVLALDQVSLEVANREFVALLGPSGCGKSTLLYLIGGFLPVETGAILIDGQNVAGPGAGPRHRLSALRAVSVEDCARKYSLWSRTARHAEGRA